MLLLALYCGLPALAQPPLSRVNPAIKQMVDQVSEERIGAIMKKLESFGTRYVGSEKDNPTARHRRRAALDCERVQELQSAAAGEPATSSR